MPRHVTLSPTAPRACFWGSLLLLFLLGLGGSLPGAERRPARKPAPPPVAPGPDIPVEKLAALARNSVVLVKQFGRTGREEGVGSGFVVSKDGLIATSLHVIGEAREVAVLLPDGRRAPVLAIEAWDRKLDLAVLRVEATGLTPLRLGDSDQLPQGTPVVAMGHPLGLENSFVQGVVSARRETEVGDMIQVAIPIEPGNSGGPLLDRRGRVLGILAMKSVMTANLGFAVPVNALQRLLDRPNPVPMARWLTLGALDPREWTSLFGAQWSRKGRRIQVEGLGQGFGGRSLCLSHRPVPAPPYDLTVRVRLEDESGAAGLVFGADGAERHYGFYPTAGQLRLTRFDGPDVYSWTILQTVPSAHYRTGDWNHLRVRVETNRLQCFVNGHLVIASDDASFRAGRTGLAKFRDTRAGFREFLLGTNLDLGARMGPESVPAGWRERLERGLEFADDGWMETFATNVTAARALLAARAEELERQAVGLREAAGQLHQRAVARELLAELRRPEPEIDLFHAALLIARLDQPELEMEPYRQQVEEMAGEIRSRLAPGADARARLEALHRYLFAEGGFHGSRTDYYNRANSYMNEVLDDREGLPITLAVLHLELARRVGLTNVSGLPLPGHFMVQFIPSSAPAEIIDVFDGGRTVSRTEAQERVFAATGEGFREEHLQPAAKREIVVRILRNLLGAAERTRNLTDQLRYLDVILALLPDSVPDRLSRLRVRLQSGQVTGARADIRWLLDHPSAAVDPDRLEELQRSLEDR